MKGQSKFIKLCLCLAVIGFIFVFLSVRYGDKEEVEGTVKEKIGGTADMAANFEPRPCTQGRGEPAYLKLHRSGELKKRGEKLWQMMESCSLCPRMCKVNRLAGGVGFCRAPGSQLIIASYMPHFGEERPLVGRGGSGTIFFAHCALRCVFCQNWDISHEGRGRTTDIERLADMMLALQKRGCHNINFVTPDHYIAHIILALDIAAGRGLRLPVVWNTSGWIDLEILKLLDGIVDIYLPDFKFGAPEMSAKYAAGAKSYPEITKQAVLEMHRQVGVANPDSDGLISRGLVIRHLIMPNDVAGSEEFLKWVAENLPPDTYINLMAQYRPAFRAHDFPQISRRISREEYWSVVERARELGLTNLDIQGHW